MQDLEAVWNKLSRFHAEIYDAQKQPPKVFYKKGVFENILKFIGKHLRQSRVFY